MQMLNLLFFNFQSPPTLPPKINYAKLDIRDNVPKAVRVDKEVQYAETKPV